MEHFESTKKRTTINRGSNGMEHVMARRSSFKQGGQNRNKGNHARRKTKKTKPDLAAESPERARARFNLY